jgi:hypothetical protein
MSKYYILERDPDVSHIEITSHNIPQNIDSRITRGNTLAIDEISSIELIFTNPDYEPADILRGIMQSEVISEKARQIFEKLDANIQFLPVKVMHKSKKLLTLDYFITNILHNVACFDYQKSIYTPFGDDLEIVASVEKIVLDESKIGDRNIFRIKEVRSKIVFSEKAMNAAVSANLSGLKFFEV